MNSFPLERYCLGSKNVTSATPPATTTKNRTAFFRWRKKLPAMSPNMFVDGFASVIPYLLCFPWPSADPCRERSPGPTIRKDYSARLRPEK